MNRHVTRRNFLAGSAAAGTALSALADTPAEKPAILGGPKAHPDAFPSWPVFDQAEERAVTETLRSGKWYRGNGRQVAAFEQAYAQLTGAKLLPGHSQRNQRLVDQPPRGGSRARRRSGGARLHVHRHRQCGAAPARTAGLRGHRSGDVPDGRAQDRSGHHPANPRHHSRSPGRQCLRPRSDPPHRRRAQSFR